MQPVAIKRFGTVSVILFLTIYIALNAIAVKDKWFFWDEFSILSAQQSSYWGLLQLHVGNFFPAGRLIFLLETRVFGNWYIGYAVVNSSLAICCAYLIYANLCVRTRLVWRKDPSPFSRIMFVALSTIFLCSRGTLYDVQWAFMSYWFISSIIVLATTLLIQLGKVSPWLLVAIAPVLVAVSASSAVPLLVLALGMTWPMTNWKSGSQRLAVWVSCMLLGAVLFVSGQAIGQLFPPTDPGERIPPVSVTAVAGQSHELWTMVSSGTLTWLVKPLLPWASINSDGLFHFWELLTHHQIIATVLLVAVAALLQWQGRWVPRSSSALLLVLLSLMVTQFLAASRFLGTGSEGLTSVGIYNRYDPLLLIAVTVLWGIALDDLSGRLLWIPRIAGTLVLFTAIVGLLSLPTAIPEASDSDGRRNLPGIATAFIRSGCQDSSLGPLLASQVPPPFQHEVCEFHQMLETG